MLTIGIWLMKAFGFFTSLLKGLLEFAVKNPAITAVLVVTVSLNFVTYHYTKQMTDKAVRAELKPTIDQLTAQIEKANAEVTARNAKIVVLEEESRKQAEDAAETIASKDKELDRVSALYKKTIASAKIESYAVNLPEQNGNAAMSVKVQVEEGSVVCNRFPSTFTETINSMVDLVNKPLDLKTTPSMILTDGVASK